jgi:hypothetical protein
MGYINVRDYSEGKQGWAEAKLPLETNTSSAEEKREQRKAG